MKNRVREALALRNMKQVELSERSGLDKAAINQYVNNKYQPKQKALYSMAKVLNVNEMWLAGYDVTMERDVVDRSSKEVATLLDKILRDKKLYDLTLNLTKLNDKQLLIVINTVNEFVK